MWVLDDKKRNLKPKTKNGFFSRTIYTNKDYVLDYKMKLKTKKKNKGVLMYSKCIGDRGYLLMKDLQGGDEKRTED